MKTTKIMSACAIAAIAGSASGAGAQVINWLAPVDGNWIDGANWAGGIAPTGFGQSATLGLSGLYTVTLTNGVAIDGLSITNPDAALEMSTQTMTLGAGGIANDGLFTLNFGASSFNAIVNFTSNSAITGTGTVLLMSGADPNDSQLNVTPGFTLTHSASHTIRGSGQLTGDIVNNGSIIADDINGLGIRIQSATVDQSGGGTISADGSRVRLASGSFINGGTFSTSNGGVISADSGVATIIGVTNNGDMEVLHGGPALSMQSGFTNNGTLTLNPDATTFNSLARADTDLTIDGSGEIVMLAPTQTNDAQLYTNGAVNLTIGSSQTVRGSGEISSALGGTIVNNGAIVADDAPFELTMRGTHAPGSGVYRADDAVLSLGSGSNFTGVTFDSTGSGRVEVQGGTATIFSATNEGQLNIKGAGHTLMLMGPLVNNGTLTMNPDLAVFNANLIFGASTEIGGAGAVVLGSAGDINDAHIQTSDGVTGTIGAGQTVRGSGRINGFGSGVIVNNGQIIADDPANQLALTGNHDGSLGGLYAAADGSMLSIRPGAVVTGGTVATTGTGIVEMNGSGVATIDTILNTGSMGIAGQGNTLALTGPLMNDGTFTINSTASTFNAAIRFDADTGLGGTGTYILQSVSETGDARIETSAGVTGIIGAPTTVQGSGTINGSNGGTIINAGTIIATDTGAGFPLDLRGQHQATSGVYRAEDNAEILLRGGASLDSGTIETAGTGFVAATSGTSSAGNLVNNGLFGVKGDGATLELTGDIVNNGTISLNPEQNVFNANILATTDIEITGTGAIAMDTGGNINDARFNAGEFTVTLGTGQIISGSGRLSGGFVSDGGLAPGGLQRLIEVDTFEMGPNSVSSFDLSGINDSEFDRVVLGNNDTITLGGGLVIQVDAGYTPNLYDTWDIISASGSGQVEGFFDSFTTPAAPLGFLYRVVYESDRVFIAYTCDSDVNGDGVLDFFDLSLFLTYYAEQNEIADFNGDGAFDFFDLSLFLTLFGGGCE